MKRIFILFAAFLLTGAGCSSALPLRPVPQPQPVACTMEAKQCPDGSFVGRSGPKCEFAACPSGTPIPVPAPGSSGVVCNGSGDTSCGFGYQCIQDCGPPVVRVDSPPPLYHCQTDAIANKPRMCPICLASNTHIATPSGDVNVTDLKIGMVVWSPDAQGKKVARVILNVSRTPVPSSHTVVHLVLSDTRQVWVSPNHPLINGLSVATLRVGDLYDGANVVSVDVVLYWDTATYDLLPDGDTGAYWANGILLESTLRLDTPKD